jgi:type 2 lantibiotic biosynthesis protein LanM
MNMSRVIADPIGDDRMDAFLDRLILRAATIDELLSDEYETLPGQKADTDLATSRLAAWCRSCASGDWALFNRRLDQDGLAITKILERFATVHRKASAAPPPWLADAIWIDATLQSGGNGDPTKILDKTEPSAFEQLFLPVVERAESLLWDDIVEATPSTFEDSARTCLSRSLLKELCNLSAAAIYERFTKFRKNADSNAIAPNLESGGLTVRYDQFIAEMKGGGFRQLFEEKPVLLRLLAAITRQWIETSRDFVLRLSADLSAIRDHLIGSTHNASVIKIEGEISDPHNGGRSVQIITFSDGQRVVYKPKDLRLDVAWQKFIEQLNGSEPPLDLKAVRAIACEGYGWTEFIKHTGCTDQESCKRFFMRAGAWLALFHCFVTSDMHQENMIAVGDHPVPVDLETILQTTMDGQETTDPEAQAFDLAVEKLANSVMMVGLLPAYGRSPDNNVFAIGGMTADWNSKIKIKWESINSDQMRPTKSKVGSSNSPNLPHIAGKYCKFGDYVDDFVSGFEQYGKFLLRHKSANSLAPFDDFAGIPVRKVVRATRFYAMLLQRLKDHRTMDDGVIWSAQADFTSRLADWDKETDSRWPIQRAERSALLSLNVPHFISPSDSDELRDAANFSMRTGSETGLSRAKARYREFDEKAIAWQLDVIRANTSSYLKTRAGREVKPAKPEFGGMPPADIFAGEADKIADELSRYAIRQGPGAAWIGIDCLGDAEVFQLVSLGPDLYNGLSGIGVFLAAHAAVRGRDSSASLALASIAHLRKNLKGVNAARMARSIGIGGATGLGSIVYALTVMSKYLDSRDLQTDAQVVADLFTDDLIAADKQLDIIGGSAGAILGLLRLYRDSQSARVLSRAIRCGEHLIAQRRHGTDGRRTWLGQGSGPQPLNGMSHGAAGFAYALASLGAVTGREEFAQAALECIEFENASFSADHNNWPDLRVSGASSWPCQWCHGAPGIGLARIATAKRAGVNTAAYLTDIRHAVKGARAGWPGAVDTLCCGTLGSIEFFCEAGKILDSSELRELATKRLIDVLSAEKSTGDLRWNAGKRQFNLGLFRGLSGVGYTALRQIEPSLANVLIWE